MDPASVEPPIWIDTAAGLAELANLLEKELCLAIDTESNSLFAYQEKVCLLQISTTKMDYLIDPFKVNLTPLGKIFVNHEIEKIFHAAEYDLICLKRDYHFEVKNLFDTMIAARILGLPEVGLGSLLQTRFGVALDKRYQRANWGVRPLSEAMKVYAALDTHYLFSLRDCLAVDLKEKGLLLLADEDFNFIAKTEGHGQNDSNLNCWKVAGAHRITPQQAAILDQLCFYRDVQARKADLPHFKVLSNQILVDLCMAEISTIEDLEKAEGMSAKLFRRFGEGLFASIKRGQAAPPIPRPHRPKMDKEYLDRIEKLKQWRKNTGKEHKVESDVILPKDLMESLAYHHPHGQNEMDLFMREFPYRRTRFGRQILEQLNQEESDENNL
jgi:ribonuclease D